jgi:hypothetical protein
VSYNRSPGCDAEFITTKEECLEAARFLGYKGAIVEVTESPRPPGCSASPGRGNIFFNLNALGQTGNANLNSICRSQGSVQIPEAYALTIPGKPACTEEDNILYWGNDFNWPNNTRIFPNGTVSDCANWCGEVEQCKFWTFVKSENNCILKEAIGSNHYINPDRVSGSKECAADCGQAEHKITCCPKLSSGDNALGTESFLQESQMTEETCWESCQKHKPGSVGITQHATQTYSNGKPKCWCEFGEAKLNEDANYQTCMFNK